MRHPFVVLLASLTAATIAATAAHASQLIDRNAANVSMKVNAKGEAMLTYTVAGKVKHVLAWGAENALAPAPGRKQVSFTLDYSGGYGKYHRTTYWDVFNGACLPYDGPALAWRVAACKAADGSYWGVQSWQRALPNYGHPAAATQRAWELRLSHWSGSAPALELTTNWAYRKYDQIFGTYTYNGQAIYGFRSTSSGIPLDSFGRNIYVDTFDSAYGKGWRRDNSFLTHRSKGSFCYGFYPHGSNPAGDGLRYRATAEGPGVAPDVMWQGNSPGTYDAAADAAANSKLKELQDTQCKPN